MLAFLGAFVAATMARGTALRQISYTKAQEKWAEVIPELCSKFVDIQFRLNMTLHVENGVVVDEALMQGEKVPSHFDPNPLTRGTAIEQKINELNRYFFLNRLWLSKNVDEKAQATLGTVQERSVRYFLQLSSWRNDPRRTELVTDMKRWVAEEVSPAI